MFAQLKGVVEFLAAREAGVHYGPAVDLLNVLRELLGNSELFRAVVATEVGNEEGFLEIKRIYCIQTRLKLSNLYGKTYGSN